VFFHPGFYHKTVTAWLPFRNHHAWYFKRCFGHNAWWHFWENAPDLPKHPLNWSMRAHSKEIVKAQGPRFDERIGALA
jgi:hypothetical protein